MRYTKIIPSAKFYLLKNLNSIEEIKQTNFNDTYYVSIHFSGSLVFHLGFLLCHSESVMFAKGTTGNGKPEEDIIG